MNIKLPPMPHGGTLIIAEDVGSRAYGKHDMEAYAREAVRLNMAPLSDEQAKQLCKVGQVYAPNGWVERTNQEYRRELEAVMLSGLRKGEAAHGIKGD